MLRLVLISAAVTLGISFPAQAAVITFDDISDPFEGTLISNGYAGLDWFNFYAANGATAAAGNNGPGYANGVVSSPNIAFNGAGANASFSSPTSNNFSVSSLDLTAAFTNGLSVTISGLENGVVVDTLNQSFNTSGPTLVTLDWSGINEVEFSSGGARGDQFVLDNLDISNTPLPATLPLFAGGLGFVGYLTRRRKQSGKQALATA
jgi:hypothetical protein